MSLGRLEGIKSGIIRWQLSPALTRQIEPQGFEWYEAAYFVCFGMTELENITKMVEHAIYGVWIRIPVSEANLIKNIQSAMNQGLGERSAIIEIDGDDQQIDIIAEIGED